MDVSLISRAKDAARPEPDNYNKSPTMRALSLRAFLDNAHLSTRLHIQRRERQINMPRKRERGDSLYAQLPSKRDNSAADLAMHHARARAPNGAISPPRDLTLSSGDESSRSELPSQLLASSTMHLCRSLLNDVWHCGTRVSRPLFRTTRCNAADARLMSLPAAPGTTRGRGNKRKGKETNEEAPKYVNCAR